MSDAEDAAAVLAQIVPLGSGSPQEINLGAAVVEQINQRPDSRLSHDADIQARLRYFAQHPQQSLGQTCPTCGGAGFITHTPEGA
jgi:hypothetical protein